MGEVLDSLTLQRESGTMCVKCITENTAADSVLWTQGHVSGFYLVGTCVGARPVSCL